MNDTLQRNPLLDPEIGDRVTNGKVTRRVVDAGQGSVWYVIESEKVQDQLMCWISSWRAWCHINEAKVLS